MIAALLLAAGVGRRFGGRKLVQELDGKPLVRWSADLLAGAPIDDVIVVVSEPSAEIRDALQGMRVRFQSTARASDGMASSIACGVAALSPDVEALVVALADEPRVPRSVLVAVVERFRAGGAEVVAPTFRGVRGHPVLFARSVFPELAALTGDRGARAVADRVPERLAVVDFDLPKPVDVDTPDDLARLRGGPQYWSGPPHPQT